MKLVTCHSFGCSCVCGGGGGAGFDQLSAEVGDYSLQISDLGSGWVMQSTCAMHVFFFFVFFLFVCF